MGRPIEVAVRLCPVCYGHYGLCGCDGRTREVGWVQGRDSLTWVEAREAVRALVQRLARQDGETPKAWSGRVLDTLGLTEKLLRGSG